MELSEAWKNGDGRGDPQFLLPASGRLQGSEVCEIRRRPSPKSGGKSGQGPPEGGFMMGEIPNP